MSKKLQLIVLPIICLLLGIALAGVYNMTAPTIAEVEKKTADDARKEVLTKADGFEEIKAEFSDDLGIVDAYKSTNGSGAAFKAVTKGYGGDITLMVGINEDGTVAGTKILTHTETPGLGAKAADPSFLEKYAGKKGELKVVKNNPTSQQDVVAVSSATTSSKAVTKAVNNVLTAFEQIKGEI